MVELGSLRRKVALAAGLAPAVLGGCVVEANLLGDDVDTGDTDVDTSIERTCDPAPELAPGSGLTGEPWLVCVDRPADGVCPETISIWQAAEDILGPVPDPEFCGWGGQVLCGPEAAIVDRCCYLATVEIWCEGRPLVIEGSSVTAAEISDAGWIEEVPVGPVPEADRLELAAAWAVSALAEHASVASLSRFTLQLLALGAPSELVARAVAATGDEVRHARRAFGIASALARRPVGPGPIVDAPAGEPLPAEVLAATIAEGCVGETIAAAHAAAARDACADPAIRGVLDGIAEDEAEHAALAWATLRWLIDGHPQLRPLARVAFARAAVLPARVHGPQVPDAVALAAGRLPGPVRLAVAARVLREVIAPAARGLLDPV